MARTDTPNVARLEEKKDSPSTRKTWDRKKTGNAAVWPCTIDGCDKQFAREADLKRHQRTTKTHSMPSFACPQCHATFTRTDAQRRHQKSRHNGVVIEGSPSASPTSSTSPSTEAPQFKGKSTDDTTAPAAPPYSGGSSSQSSSAAGSSSSSRKYYREDSGGFAPTYSLYPTTSARHPGWAPANWPTANPHFAPSPYYRSSTSYMRGPTLPPLTCSADSDSSFSESPSSTPISPTVPSRPGHYPRHSMEPSITRPEPLQQGGTPEEIELTMKAVMRYVEVDSATRHTGGAPPQHDKHSRESITPSDERDQSLPLEDIIHHYDSPVHRPGSLQDILTEDCEPIFHASSTPRES
ncbi:hypothetical protein FA13DRAFT_1724484 [Coprinellus micaceus]|uniref:C2H2-type domain-containing protein n=1 Tax=Coprinellus micaceus TaxID=71717 RepID=A0A4Y7TWH2_COPMI|nr:hypothetical protein FA13DRAFT_1724484 [Coprinellus micaceus]